MIVGGNGQLGRALRPLLPDAESASTCPSSTSPTRPPSPATPWRGVGAIINAAAYTAVDAAETPEGRRACWAANVTGVGQPVPGRRASTGIPLVHVSTDYVFDGTAEVHTEDEPFSPLGVYGQTKAAGDALVGAAAPALPRAHQLGDRRRAQLRPHDGRRSPPRASSPSVVDDQFGRLTFTADLAAGIVHLLATAHRYGTYNLTNDGPTRVWATSPRVFELRGRSADDVTAVTTGSTRRQAGRPPSGAQHPRPGQAATRLRPAPCHERLREYLAELPITPGGVR